MELLVVITIMVILTAAMIPVMSVASDARRLREAARTVSTMLASRPKPGHLERPLGRRAVSADEEQFLCFDGNVSRRESAAVLGR